MEENLIDIYNEVRECDYKGEHYSVRDNGAIMRHPNGYRKRPADNQWTFGNKDVKTGYMTTLGVRVHIVVATAFYGANDSTIMVVDHIDTNRCNNRPENLRWITRLENILLNPYTRHKVEYICGSIENFLNNPELLYGHESEDNNFTWMRAVTREEAANTLKHLDQLQERPTNMSSAGNKMGDWIYQSIQRKEDSWNIAMIPTEEELRWREERMKSAEEERNRPIPTSNPLAFQRGWSVSPIFPLCPETVGDNPLNEYLIRLQEGAVFITSHYGNSIVHKYVRHDDQLIVITKIIGGVKPWGLTIITWENGMFVHQSSGTYFEENGVLADFTRAQGLDWDGSDSIDDYC